MRDAGFRRNERAVDTEDDLYAIRNPESSVRSFDKPSEDVKQSIPNDGFRIPNGLKSLEFKALPVRNQEFGIFNPVFFTGSQASRVGALRNGSKKATASRPERLAW